MKLKPIVTIVFIVMLIAACAPSPAAEEQGPTPDIAAVRTSAASTVISEFTLTAAAFTPTPSLPTETAETSALTPAQTATATQQFAQVTDVSGTTIALCDLLNFDPATVDVNVPDGTTMTPGQDFIKTWRVKNNGSCPWDPDYELVYAGYADQMSGQFQPLTEVVQPGQEVELSVQFRAPDEVGQYLSAWQMSNPAGVTFPEPIYVKIIVQ
ncbi:MAG TPA: NBR1-Ig-like domain-containing protein [Anaerolineales bacterium]|nr:NBR1-Ig-like domain-containing protein [Anaerolineales bacterium]